MGAQTVTAEMAIVGRTFTELNEALARREEDDELRTTVHLGPFSAILFGSREHRIVELHFFAPPSTSGIKGLPVACRNGALHHSHFDSNLVARWSGKHAASIIEDHGTLEFTPYE